MRRRALLLALVLAVPGPALAQAPDPVAPLAWLAGCWELRTPTRVTLEQWMPPAGGLMLGMSRTLVRGAAREFEFLRLQAREGVAVYVAQPGGRPPTVFPATVVTDSSATFENLAHDFPQRIIYRRRGADSLVARVEGGERGFDLPMARVACP